MSSSPAQIQIMSDLHLECNKTNTQQKQYEFKVRPEAPILALLGDIGFVEDYRDADGTGQRASKLPHEALIDGQPHCEQGFYRWLEECLVDFEYVLYVMGNHEPYGTSWDKAKSTMKSFEQRMERKWEAQGQNLQESGTQLQRRGRFIYLDGVKTFDIPGSNVTILGCTLFSQISQIQRDNIEALVSDFTHISDWTVEAHNKAFSRDLSRLNGQVGRIPLDRKIVVLTHYAPTLKRRAIDPEHWDSEFSSAFATTLRGKDVWEDERVVCWAFGHTHYNCDFVLDRSNAKKKETHRPIRIVANQKGYPWEDGPGYNGKVITIS